MAIDDNTSYELTGAQVKDLANKIKAKAADNIFVGATSAAPGSKGLVPQPQAGDEAKVLSGAGAWVNQPTVPTVNDATLTLVQNGTIVGTFTANQNTNTTVNLAGGIYADDPTTQAQPTAWVTGSDINWSTFLVKRNLTLTTDSTGNIATDIPIATYDVISCRCTNPNNSRNVFITPYAWSTGYWQIHVQNVAGNGAYQGSLNVDFLLIDKTKTGV